MRIFIKFGGSVITDKRGQEAPDMPVIEQLAGEMHHARREHPDHQIVLGHGSGSFGHHYAARYGIHRGLGSSDDWIGFALTANAALRLNRIVVEALLATHVSALSLQPSATLQSQAGIVQQWNITAIGAALDRGLVPVIHGDVAFDVAQGSAIISTEKLFEYLALETDLKPDRIVLVGEDAVYTADPRLDPHAQPIRLITSANIEGVLHAAGDSHAVDVTGGMHSKVELMWRLVQAIPGLEVHLIGPKRNLLARALTDQAAGEGTVIRV